MLIQFFSLTMLFLLGPLIREADSQRFSLARFGLKMEPASEMLDEQTKEILEEHKIKIQTINKENTELVKKIAEKDNQELKVCVDDFINVVHLNNVSKALVLNSCCSSPLISTKCCDKFKKNDKVTCSKRKKRSITAILDLLKTGARVVRKNHELIEVAGGIGISAYTFYLNEEERRQLEEVLQNVENHRKDLLKQLDR